MVSGFLLQNIHELTALRILSLGHSVLSGTLGGITMLTNLAGFGFGANRVSGTVGTQLASLNSLVMLDLQANSLSGVLDGKFFLLTTLTTLDAASNQLWATSHPDRRAAIGLPRLRHPPER